MNENLKGVKKNNVVYEFKRTDNKNDFESTHKKGYVNWPFAIESGTTSLDHLPTGLQAYPVLPKPRNFTEAKRLLDHIVTELNKIEGVDLETEEGIASVKEKYFMLCQSEVPEKEEGDIDDFITVEYSILFTSPGAIRRQFTKEGQNLIFDFPDQRIKINKKDFSSYLTSLGSSAIIRFVEICDKELVTERLNENKYMLEVVRQEVHRCLAIEYQSEGVTGVTHFPEMK